MAIFVACLALTAQASLVDLGYGSPTSTGGIDPVSEQAYLASLGYTGLTYLDKWTRDPAGWDQAFHDTTVLTAVSTGTGTANVGWDLTGTGWLMGLVTLKDGQDGGNKGRYHIYGITADETLMSGSLQGVSYIDPSGDPKNISHVTFWGVRDPGVVVPEPSTYIAGMLLLLPFGASTLRALRKK